jgi:hypothetical protein
LHYTARGASNASRTEHGALLGEIMADGFTPARYASLTRALCLVVLAIMTVALVYAGWIAISNYSRIGV